MADKNHGSIYDKYWIMIRDCRKKRGAIVELAVPEELQDRVIKAIRKRKWLDQYATGRDYGTMLAVKNPRDSNGIVKQGVIHFQILPPMHQRI